MTITWGAAAFGSNYPWAYRPLLLASALVGLAGIFLGAKPSTGTFAIAAGLALVAIAVALQLLPLEHSLLIQLSPHADDLLLRHDIGYALQPREHALSIEPGRTRLGLLFLGCLGLLFLGTAMALTRATARQLAFALVIVGAALALAGIVQRATFTGQIYGFWKPLYGRDPFGPFVNRHHFAGWKLMGLPLAIGLFSAMVSRGFRGSKAGWRQRILWMSTPDASQGMIAGFALFAMALSLVMTMSRSGMLGLAGALCISAAEGGLSPLIWWIRMGAVTGLVAIAVQSLVELSLQIPGNAVFFAVLAGLAVHDGRSLTDRRQKARQ